MSFILQDEQLLLDLAHALIKNSQAPAPDPAAIARKLVDNLQREYGNAPAPLNISSGTADPSEPIGLNVSDMQSIGKFLQFLANNAIKLNGTRIAYSGVEYNQLPEDEKNKLSTISVNMSRDAATRKWNELDYWVNLPLLIQYVHYLQEKASAMEKSGDAQGQILRVMVGKLIDSINTIKPDSGLSRMKEKATPENPNVIADDVELDDFNTKTLDIKNPTADKGANQVKLLAKDVKTREALNAWLQGGEGGEGGEAKIVMYDAKGQRTEVPFSDDKADSCVAINTLYQRARRWLQLSKSSQDTKRFTYYVKQIQELGPTFTGLNNKPCTVAGATATTTTTPATTAPAAGGAAGAALHQNVSRAVSALPFGERNIDFTRIRTFFQLVGPLMTNVPSVASNIQMVDAEMHDITNKTLNQATIFPLGLRPEQFANMLANQQTPADDYQPMLIRLNRVLDGTRAVVDAFYSQYASMLSSNEQQYIDEQIGRSPTDSSLYESNAEQLGRLRVTVQKQ